MKKAAIILFSTILICILYLLFGMILPYRPQPAVSREYQASFRAEDCYSDSVSCERACILEDNEDALRERLRMIEQAQDRIILSTFEIRADESGKDMLAMLLAAAERGVSVKILSDGMGALLRMDRSEYFHALAANENVEIRIYNRISLLSPWKIMGRLHDKYVIVDKDLYLLGGRNTYDYFLGDNGYKNYDRDVLVYTADPDSAESSIHQLEAYFESVWNLKACTPFKAWSEKRIAAARTELEERCRTIRTQDPALSEKADYEAMTFEVNKITLLSNPTHVRSKEPTLFYSLAELMKHSEGEISIHTPYIICNDWMYDAFREICETHPTRLLTNSAANNGNPFGASDYLLNKEKLIGTGFTIYEYEGGVSYHGKSIAIGDRMSVIGSFNMDMRSVYLDTELMLAIDSEGVNRQLRENMQTYEALSVKVLDPDHYEIPGHVTRQTLTAQKARRIRILKLLNWLRFLM